MLKKILILMLILMPVALADLSQYPQPFVVDHYTNGLAMVMGSNYVAKHAIVAAEIAYSLRPINGNYITRLDTEVINDYQKYDLILVGTPCQNMIVAKVLNSEDCTFGLGPGEAVIKLADNGDKKALIIAGYDFDSLRNAGLILANYNKYDIKGDEYKIYPEEGSQPTAPEETPTPENKIYSGKCDGCLVAQSCLKKGDKLFNSYCDGSQMTDFKPAGQECKENYECINENCINNICKNKGIFQRFIEWIKSIF